MMFDLVYRLKIIEIEKYDLMNWKYEDSFQFPKIMRYDLLDTKT